MRFIITIIISSVLIGIDGLGVKLYDRRNREGEYLRLEVSGCTNIPLHWDNQASSVDTEGECILFYEGEKCKGRQVALQPYHNEYQMNMAHEKIGFSDVVSSVSPCGKVLTAGKYIVQNAADGSVLTAGKAGTATMSPWRPFIQIKKDQQWDITKNNFYEMMPSENIDDNPIAFDKNTLYEFDKESRVYQKNLNPARNHWKIESAYRGRYRIRNEATGLCLVKEKARDEVGEADCDKWTPRQEWIFRIIPDPSKPSSILKAPPPPPVVPTTAPKDKKKDKKKTSEKDKKKKKKDEEELLEEEDENEENFEEQQQQQRMTMFRRRGPRFVYLPPIQ